MGEKQSRVSTAVRGENRVEEKVEVGELAGGLALGTIDLRGGVEGPPGREHGHIVLQEPDEQPLPEVAPHHPQLVARGPGQLLGELADGLQGEAVPATEGVDGDWRVGETLGLAPGRVERLT